MYLNNWNNLDEMKADFWPPYCSEYAGELDGANVLLASYGTPSYEGYAFVLFERDGKLYEVNGSHCSCHGLEGQWQPEETTVEALRHRLEQGNLGAQEYDGNPFAAELRAVLDSLNANAPGNQHAEDLRQRCDALQARVDELTNELAAAEKDAKRYAFIRRHATLDTPHFFWSCDSPGSEIDAAIDAVEKWTSK